MALGAGVLLIAARVFGPDLLGVHRVEAGVPPPAPSAGPFRHDVLDGVLREHVRDGRVDYAALAADPHALRSYVAALGAAGPRSTPGRFDTRAERFAYYINAYNALTLLGVVAHWPIESVHDVRGPVELAPGTGFFWGQRFQLDGAWMHLHELEHGILRPDFADARVHAAINCASNSCPALWREACRPENLDAMLEAAARRFTSDPAHVVVDHDGRAIVLSEIFSWFEDDFEEHARVLGVGTEVLDWIAHHADPQVAAELAEARSGRYTVRFQKYDWGLNAAP